MLIFPDDIPLNRHHVNCRKALQHDAKRTNPNTTKRNRNNRPINILRQIPHQTTKIKRRQPVPLSIKMLTH